MKKTSEIKQRLLDAGIRHWAGDNISSVLEDGDKELLINEATVAFEGVLDDARTMCQFPTVRCRISRKVTT